MVTQNLLNAAEFLAGLMVGHYENPMASPGEFVDDSVPNADQIVKTLDAINGGDVYGPETLELRQEILKQLTIQLKLD